MSSITTYSGSFSENSKAHIVLCGSSGTALNTDLSYAKCDNHAGAFLAVHAWGTVVTVLVKGIACGLLAGLAFKGVKKITKNDSAVTFTVDLDEIDATYTVIANDKITIY